MEVFVVLGFLWLILRRTEPDATKQMQDCRWCPRRIVFDGKQWVHADGERMKSIGFQSHMALPDPSVYR